MSYKGTFSVCVLVCGLFVAGCGDGSSGGAPVAPASQSGVVGQLTGDSDDEVDPQLQALVSQAIARDADDDPLDF